MCMCVSFCFAYENGQYRFAACEDDEEAAKQNILLKNAVALVARHS